MLNYPRIPTYIVTNTRTKHQEYMSAAAIGASLHRRDDNHKIDTIDGQYLGMTSNGAFYAHMPDPVASRKRIASAILAMPDKQDTSKRRIFVDALRVLRLCR